MSIDPGTSIVISFAMFAYIFAKKIYPPILKMLDEHIESVKNKIREAEEFKDSAYVALKQAYTKKDDTQKIIADNRLKSEERIRKLQQENERLLKALRERHTVALQMQLDAELAKHKNRLVERLSDLLIERISEKVSSPDCEVSTNISKSDLQKLLGTHMRGGT
jgi:F0F1-type ATP synthase membrane subunit b/b'